MFYLRRTRLAVAVGHEFVQRDSERPDVRGFVKLPVDQTLRSVPTETDTGLNCPALDKPSLVS